MVRTACVDLAAFPLQLLLGRHPDWKEQPAAVIDEDRPQGRILWVNEQARASHILPGMRYAAGLSLTGNLRAGVVPPAEIRAAIARLAERLRRFTPGVETAGLDTPAGSGSSAGSLLADTEPGIFWLDASGLERLYRTPKRWVDEIKKDLEGQGWLSSIVVGFTRFGTYALARATDGILILRTPDDERAAARRTPIDRLSLEPAARDALARLGVTDIGSFTDLPVEGIHKRFGRATARLHRLASGDLAMPVQPDRPTPPAVEHVILDYAVADSERLVAWFDRMLAPLLVTLGKRAESVAELELGFRFGRLGDHVESIRPAAPTLDARQLIELVRLRLEAVRKLPDAAEELWLTARGVSGGSRQLAMFASSRRDPDAANRALARVRANLGDDAVVRAELRDAHLPEGSFSWERFESLKPAAPRETDKRGNLIRRIHTRPTPLPHRPRHEPDGWMLRGLDQGPVVRVFGPYVISGGWWNRAIHREYHYAETEKGEILWVYYDRLRRRWYQQGRVE
jgi:protein ImuB